MTKCEIILDTITMEQLLDYYNIPKRSHNYKCCFHNDKNPSATISKDNKWFKCFGCGVCWNVIDFVCHYENCTRKKAIDKINVMFNLNLKNTITEEELKEIYKAKEKRKRKAEENLRQEKQEWWVINKINSSMELWRAIEYKSLIGKDIDRYKSNYLVWVAIKRQRWLEFLYNKITGKDTLEFNEFYFKYKKNSSKDIVKKIINQEISL